MFTEAPSPDHLDLVVKMLEGKPVSPRTPTGHIPWARWVVRIIETVEGRLDEMKRFDERFKLTCGCGHEYELEEETTEGLRPDLEAYRGRKWRCSGCGRRVRTGRRG